MPDDDVKSREVDMEGDISFDDIDKRRSMLENLVNYLQEKLNNESTNVYKTNKLKHPQPTIKRFFNVLKTLSKTLLKRLNNVRKCNIIKNVFVKTFL